MICIHAGHAPDGKLGCGATGNILNESTLNRMMKNNIIENLRSMGIPYYDSTIEEGGAGKDILLKIHSHDYLNMCSLGISIHFNTSGTHTVQGTEVYAHTFSKSRKGDLEGLSRTIADALGIQNRGVKNGDHLYYCNRPSYPSLLIEVAFCDIMTQTIIDKLPSAAARIATWIASNYNAITGKVIPGYEEPDDVNTGAGAGAGTGAGTTTDTPTDIGTGTNSTARTLYRVQVGAFADPANAGRLCEELSRKGYQAMVTKVTTI